MRNEAMFYDKDKPNPFTEIVKQECLANGKFLVRMRNGTFVEVIYCPADEEDDYSGGFETEGVGMFSGRWYMDGSSLTSQDFDMVEVKNNL